MFRACVHVLALYLVLLEKNVRKVVSSRPAVELLAVTPNVLTSAPFVQALYAERRGMFNHDSLVIAPVTTYTPLH